MKRPAEALVEDYARSTREFVEGSAKIGDAAWTLPRAPGKWSPAQEVEHITLAHELLAQQLAGGPAMRVVVHGWRRLALRWVVLPWILRTGRFPRGARAPREARPSAAPAARRALIERLEAAVTAVGGDLGRSGDPGFSRRLDHPYFGAMSVAHAVRLSAVHTRHHLASLSRSVARGA